MPLDTFPLTESLVKDFLNCFSGEICLLAHFVKPLLEQLFSLSDHSHGSDKVGNCGLMEM